MAESFLAVTAVWAAIVTYILRLVNQKVPENVMVCLSSRLSALLAALTNYSSAITS